jgi:2-iminobutanoate/2-iminopropanoate deaminase
MSKKVIFTTAAPAPIGPYSQAVQIGDTVFTSGQIAIDPATNIYTPLDVEAEALLVMKNLEALLKAAGTGFEHVIKTSIFLKTMSDFGTVNTVYSSFFASDFPARETVEVACLPKDCKVEISMVAWVPGV